MKRFRCSTLAAILLVASISNAETLVAGVIDTNSWTPAGSPYRITDDVAVAAGDTLTIGAGVDVLFDANARFIVDGKLRANGTEQDSVRFLLGTAEMWRGIRIEGQDTTALNYVRISGGVGQGGIPGSHGGAIFARYAGTHIDLSHCVISGNEGFVGGGINCSDQASMNLTDCVFRDNYATGEGGGISCGPSAVVTMTNCIVTDNTGEGAAGGIRNAFGGSTLTMVNCTVSNNYQGGIYNREATLNMTDCIVSGNSGQPVGSKGGGIYNYLNATANLTRCSVTDNVAYEAGAIYAQSNCFLTLTNCTVAGNSAAYRAGGVALYSTNTVIDNSILWNDGPQEIYLSSGSITIEYSDIKTGFGIGESSFEAYPVFTDSANGDYSLQLISPCIDTGDPASPLDPDGTRADMGAVYKDHIGSLVNGWVNTTTWTTAESPYQVLGDVTVSAGETLTIEAGVDVVFDVDARFYVEGLIHVNGTQSDSVRFIPGAAPEWGGLKIVGAGTHIFSHTRISGGNADGSSPFDMGGGIWASGSEVELTLSDVVVSDNAAVYGAGITGVNITLNMTRCAVSDNNASWDGGGLHLFNCDVTLEDCLIVGNSAQYDGGGGVIYSSSFDMIDGIIEDNSCMWRNGGGLYFDSSLVTIADAGIYNNLTTWGSGGGLICLDSSMVSLSNCSISGNDAAYSGSGVHLESSSATVVDCMFDGNTSHEENGNFGGAFYAYDAQLTIQESQLVNNFASYGGGALWAEGDATVLIERSLLAKNEATYEGGGIAAWRNAAVTLVNCTVASNRATDPTEPLGGGFNVWKSPINVTNTIVWGNTPEDVFIWDGDPVSFDATYSNFGGGSMLPGAGNIGADPFFVDAANGDYSLMATSPCIDAGDPASTHDPDGTLSDIGAIYFESVTVGGQVGGQMWTADMGAIHITEACTVAAEQTLTIGPGVDVRFDADVSINIAGSLVTNGAFTDSIRFLPGTSPGWDGLKFDSGSSTLSFTRVSGVNNVTPGDNGAVRVRNIGTYLAADNCVIDGNHGIIAAGIFVTDQAVVDLDRCTIKRNIASNWGGGLVVLWEGNVTATQCVIADNHAEQNVGGVSSGWLGEVTLVNCTIVRNSARTGAGIAAYSDGLMYAENCITWYNEPDNAVGTLFDNPGELEVIYSNISGGWADEGNIEANPLFTDTLNGDYSLQLGSPCINSGNPLSPQDLDETRADMGAIPSHIPFLYGDVSRNGSVSALDASEVLRYLVGKVPSINASLADVTDNGSVSAWDASHILHRVVDPTFVFPVELNIKERPSSQVVRHIWWTSDGDKLALVIDDPTGVEAIEITLATDVEPLRSIEVDGLSEYRYDDGTLDVAVVKHSSSNDPVLFALLPSQVKSSIPQIVSASLNEGTVPYVVGKPYRFELAQNAPNPFNPSTTIRFNLPERGNVLLAIYSVTGQHIQTLVREMRDAGRHSVVWDGTDASGRNVASGVYLYRIESAAGVSTMRMSLVR
jgi:predicted outer membrane repeat protein